jgi:ABC-type transport system involved in multi-copper enzyme maturation permease subunit
MIWLTWRQFRTQSVLALAALAVAASYLVYLGLTIRHSYDAGVDPDTFRREFFGRLLLSGALLVAVPVVVGIFWGAPLIARELETGTYRLVWNQSITRTRWLTVKLAVVTLAGVLLTGALSLLLTWAASPYDQVVGGRFDALIFPARNLAPVGYAVFALVLGTAVGLFARRTVPAMAITLAGLIAFQILMPAAIRPHLQRPITQSVAFDAETPAHGGRVNIKDKDVRIEGYALAGAWVLTGSAPLLTASGRPVSGDQLRDCGSADSAKVETCVAAQNLHFIAKYQPAGRYWTFQWLELAIFLLMAALLAAVVFRRIARA